MRIACFVMLVCMVFAGAGLAANPQVTLHVSGAVEGDIVVELYADKAPVSVANFIDYVQSGFYDGLLFHRVIEDFMIQGGGYNTDPNLMETGEAIINECINGLSNARGTIAMARQSHPHSATSQFFINHADNTNLDMELVYDSYGNAYYWLGYAVFGSVVSGMDVVDAIAATATHDVTLNGIAFEDVPVNNIIIETAELTAGVAACLEKMDGDIDGDCDVDYFDFALLAENWLTSNALN